MWRKSRYCHIMISFLQNIFMNGNFLMFESINLYIETSLYKKYYVTDI